MRSFRCNFAADAIRFACGAGSPHHERDLAKRIVGAFHDHHDLAQATLHVHVDHHTCLEVAILRGQADAVQSFADHIIAERGVRHGQLTIVKATKHRPKSLE